MNRSNNLSNLGILRSITMATQKVLLVLFPGFNTLDMNGPYEILRKANDGNAFDVTVASETPITISTEGASIQVCFPLFRPLRDFAPVN